MRVLVCRCGAFTEIKRYGAIDGLSSDCAACRKGRQKERERAWYLANPEKVRAQRDRRREIERAESAARRAELPQCRFCDGRVCRRGVLTCAGDECRRLRRNEMQRGFYERHPRYQQLRYEEERRTTAHVRRARKRAVDFEVFSPREVFERDGWVCGICSAPVDPDLRHPDRMAASLDHVVPLSRGGEHSMANTQCSHWICNSRKSDSLAG